MDAARASAHYANKAHAPLFTGSIKSLIEKLAVPGADGDDDDDDAQDVSKSAKPKATPVAKRVPTFDRQSAVY